jgi:hypothetical protein
MERYLFQKAEYDDISKIFFISGGCSLRKAGFFRIRLPTPHPKELYSKPGRVSRKVMPRAQVIFITNRPGIFDAYNGMMVH